MTQIIEKKGKFKLIQADSIEQLHILIKEKQPDLVIIDSDSIDNESIENNLDVEKNQYFTDVPTIIMGASATHPCMQSGIDYINKPIDVSSVLKKISIILNET